MNKNVILSVTIIILMIVLALIPTGFEKEEDPTYIKVRAKVMSVDNSQLEQIGIVKVGSQSLQIKILDGKFKGKTVDAPNLLSGKLEIDKIFEPSDTILAVISYNYDEILSARALDYYRIHLEWILVGIFVAILIVFAGWTGFNALTSFCFTTLMIWKVLIPLFLLGYQPLVISAGVVIIICAAVIFLVAGINKKGVVAFLGSSAGIVVTCIFAIIFGKLFKVHGAIMPYAESLLYAGFAELDLTGIFLSGIYLASSGAIMDVAIDISASMQEIIYNSPTINKRDLLKSGFNVGRAIIGTMTTTLLLAYSGGFTALMMLFMAQGIPMVNILNYNFIAGEILHTLVGSFGLILTAPLTAFIGSILFTKNQVSLSDELSEKVV